MLKNPFTPSKAASQPGEFFGREEQQSLFLKMIQHNHIVRQRPIAIGKTSWLEHMLRSLEGFESDRKCVTYSAVGNKGVTSIGKAAQLILKSFTTFHQIEKTSKFKASKILGIEKGTTTTQKPFSEDTCLFTLTEFILKASLEQDDLLVIAIDEADRCPALLAQLLRVLISELEHYHVDNVRFVISGVNPYWTKVVEEDGGLDRFFETKIPLSLLSPSDAEDLIETKLRISQGNIPKDTFEYDYSVVETMCKLSGGHPHILQLLGFHLLHNEDADPDGYLDIRDLRNAVENICYQSRAEVYNNLIHELELSTVKDLLVSLFGLASSYCPTLMPRADAIEYAGEKAIRWFVDNNIFQLEGSSYRLVDEFLRIRLVMDSESDRAGFEEQLLTQPDDIQANKAYYVSEEIAEFEESEDVPTEADIRDYDILPILKIAVVNNPEKCGEPILFELMGKARTEDFTNIDPVLDELAVSIYDSLSDTVVVRRILGITEEVRLSVHSWQNVGQIALPVPEAGSYYATVEMRPIDSDSSAVVAESLSVKFSVPN